MQLYEAVCSIRLAGFCTVKVVKYASFNREQAPFLGTVGKWHILLQ